MYKRWVYVSNSFFLLFSSLQYPSVTSEVPVADHTAKVKMTFDLVNKADKTKVTLHQVSKINGERESP